MATVAVLLHPFASVPVTVYVVAVTGSAVTAAPIVPDKPIAGDQLYVTAPLAVNRVLLPLQIVTEAGVTVIVGNEFTVTLTVAVFMHPFASVPVTV